MFRVLAYHHLQNGPAFPEASDVSFDRETGRYRASVGDKRAEGTLDIPEDLHNGITSLLLRHLPASGSAAGHLAYFGPKPRMLKTTLRPEGTDKYSGAGPGTATRYLLKVEIGGVTGVVADLVGKGPPDVRYWITRGEAPAFARFEGAMFVKGPVWRIEIAAPRWP